MQKTIPNDSLKNTEYKETPIDPTGPKGPNFILNTEPSNQQLYFKLPLNSGMNSGIRIENQDDGNKDTFKLVSYTGCTGYSLKIDHWGNSDAVNISSKSKDFTAFSVNGSNTLLSTVKVVNDSAQTNGSVITAWGTNPNKTNDIISAWQWGSGPCFSAVINSNNGIFYDSSSSATGTVIGYNSDIVNSAGQGIRIKHSGEHKNNELALLWHSNTGTTTTVLNLVNEGSGSFLTCRKGGVTLFNVANDGSINTNIVKNRTYHNYCQKSGSCFRSVMNDVTTTSNNSTSIFSFSVPNNTVYIIEATINSIRTGGTSGNIGDACVFIIRSAIKNIGGTLTQVGTLEKTSHKNPKDLSWDVLQNINNGSNYNLSVVGAINNNITWDINVSRFGRLSGF